MDNEWEYTWECNHQCGLKLLKWLYTVPTQPTQGFDQQMWDISIIGDIYIYIWGKYNDKMEI